MSGKPPQTWAEISEAAKRAVPDGTWIHCPACNASLFHRALEANLWVCPECGHHFRLDAVRRIETLVDPDSFEPMDEDLQAVELDEERGEAHQQPQADEADLAVHDPTVAPDAAAGPDRGGSTR